LQSAETLVQPPRWDEGDWHFHADAGEIGPLTAQYVFVLDALNFCFWPSTTGIEYDILATGLKRVLEKDSAAFSSERLQSLTTEQLASWFKPHDMPNAPERVRKLHELGLVLAAQFDGLAINLVRAAKQSAVACVRLIVSNLPGFRDEAIYKSCQVFLYKRAQICVGDLWAAYGQGTAGASPFAFTDIDQLTCFADYRIPQLFRSQGVFVYTAKLAATIDSRRELAASCEEEVEIRACTVHAVERLRAKINELRAAAHGSLLTSVQVDWLLWQKGEREKDTLSPHHRTRTIFY
jgi:hypothetical protein